MNVLTQPELLALLRRDPPKGIEKLISAFGALAEKTVRTAGITRNEDVEEILNDVFYAVYASREEIDLEKGSVATYVITLSRRKAIDRLRKNAVQREDAVPIEDLSLLPSGISTAEEAERREQSRALTDALLALGEPDATILFRRFYYDESWKTIGKRLRMTENAVNKRALRAMKKLRTMLKGE